MLINFRSCLVKYGILEVREVSRNLPGARGSALAEYEPVASHGDPIQPKNYRLGDINIEILILRASFFVIC